MEGDFDTLEADLKNPKANPSLKALQTDVKNVEKGRNGQNRNTMEAAYQKSEGDLNTAAAFVKQYPKLLQLNRNALLIIKEFVKILQTPKYTMDTITKQSDNLAHLFDYELKQQTSATFGGQ